MLSVNNKTIFKNTIFLYLRMLLILGVNLYTVREILNLLGVVDYGIFNVVGSVVGMFAFLNGTLTTSSQRFFSVELAKNDNDRLNKWFNLSISFFSILIVIVIFFAETIGLWFVNNVMTIPTERIWAANVVYQISVISCIISVYAVSYTALIVSHEKMGTFAFIGIAEAVFKLIIVFVLYVIHWDKLVVYGAMLLISSIVTTSMYIYYCRSHFKESLFKPYWNKLEFKEMLGFSGWHFLGTISSVIKNQGINLLINVFFNPVVNAARAISFQVNSAVVQFSDNYTLAVKPQLYMFYSRGELNNLYKLIFRSTILAFFLSSLLVIPLVSNASFILEIWLKNVPEFAVLFTQLVLINGLIESSNTSAIVPALATGNIKKFEIVIATLAMLNLPISYIFLKLGAPAYYTMIISIVMSLITVFWRAFLLRDLINLPYKKYIIVLFRLIFVSSIITAMMIIVSNRMTHSFINLCLSSAISSMLLVLSYFYFIISRDDKKIIMDLVKEKVKKINI